jgi:drug/metabolite transporter (DMT)-like permease
LEVGDGTLPDHQCFRAIEAGSRQLIVARGGTRSGRLSRSGYRHTRAVESELVSDGKNKAVILTEVSLILAAVFWGLNFAATKYAAESIPPLVIVAFRFTGGGLLLLLILRLLEPESRPGPKDLVLMAALGCFGVAVAQSGFTFGVSLTSAASTGLIFATAPVWGLLLGAVLGLERPTIRGILGLALSVVGVAVVVFEGLGSGGDSLAGDLLVLMASVGVGGYTVLSMPLLERHTPLAVAGYPVVFGAPFLLVLSSGYILDLEWGSVGVGTWAAVAFSALFATAFAFAGWQRGISRIGANRVLVYQYLITVVGVASGIIFFGETLGIEKIVGGAVILIGVYLARRQ